MNLKLKNHHILKPKFRRCTLAISVPSKADLVEMLNNFYVNCTQTGYDGQLGIALVSPKDHFNHKVGRKVASEKLIPVYYFLTGLDRIEGGTIYKFVVTNPEKTGVEVKQVNFLVHPDKDVVHIQFVDVTNVKRLS